MKDHLVQGYTLNQRRLTGRGIEFKQAVSLLSRTLTNQDLVSTEGEAVARVISDYARSWSLLQGYDDQQLTELFGQVRGDGLTSALAIIEQGFGDGLFTPMCLLGRCTAGRFNDARYPTA